MEGWDKQADQLWCQGQQQAAIDRVLNTLNQSGSPKPRASILQLAYFFFLLNDFAAGETILSLLVSQDPRDEMALENRAVMRHRQGNYAQAYADFSAVVAIAPNAINAWDGMAATAAKLEQWDEAQRAGEHALCLKDEACRYFQGQQLPVSIPQNSPQDWDATHPGTDVIAFSLWGNNPRYLRGAVCNVLESQRIYPGWVCRFYGDASVPTEFWRFLEAQGGQGVIESEHQSLRQKLTWRFHVANDPTVRRFLVRDADSVVSLREASAVKIWLQSDRWFHVMRDWWTHTELILAGMWGGRAGLLGSLSSSLSTYQSGKLETANIDQWFLRDCVWNAIRSDCLIHDRYFRVLGSQPWPDPDPSDHQHVGENEAIARPQKQRQQLGSLVDQYSWLRES